LALWLPARELSRISISPSASRGRRFFRLQHPPGKLRTHLRRQPRFCGQHFDEFVQWMVQDPSLDR
jgi:hypothetical protein